MRTINETESFKHKLTPMAHQEKIFLESAHKPYYALYWEMGTGKSKTLIDTFTWLYMNQQIDGVIIVSDKGAYLNWPLSEIPKTMIDIPHRIATYSSSMNSTERWRMEQMMVAKDDCLDILVMNVEAFSGERAADVANRFCNSHYTMIAVDEATSIKNIKSERTKKLIAIARKCDYRRILTGTPITLSPLDLYSQCEFLQPGILGHRTFVGFRNEYAEMRTMTFGSRSFQMVAGYRNLEKLTSKIQQFSSRILKENCLDLPDKVYETIYVERLYDKLKGEAMVLFEQGLLTSTSAITTINKLHQINCGHVKLDDGTQIDIPNNRIPALLELLEKIPGKCLIWCAFQRDVELILAALAEVKDGYACHYYGRTTDTERARALELFDRDPLCKWFVGTAATGGKGLTLIGATTTIYYSNSDSAEDRWQSEDRNHRKGQTQKVTYFDLVSPGTVDVKKLQQLQRKEDLAFQVLDKFRDMLAG